METVTRNLTIQKRNVGGNVTFTFNIDPHVGVVATTVGYIVSMVVSNVHNYRSSDSKIDSARQIHK